jgi:DNA-binding HxlR family transcriptional regulator
MLIYKIKYAKYLHLLYYCTLSFVIAMLLRNPQDDNRGMDSSMCLVRRRGMVNPLDDTVCRESIRAVMDIFGGKWTFLIMGEMHSGARHFNELGKSLGISTKSLSDALKGLEANGIVTRTVLPTTPVTIEYTLTDKGRDFERVFYEMREWGRRWMGPWQEDT